MDIPEGYLQVERLLQAGHPLVFVSGNAGTGKTTLIRYLRRMLPLQSVVVAPTGVAALNAGGSTIHSFFQFPPRLQEPRDVRVPADPRLHRRLQLLMIDEVSMLRCDIMDAIDTFLRRAREDARPFGGVQLLLLGDMFQLPPVVPRPEWAVLESRGYAGPYFFDAAALADLPLAHVELDRVYRQADPTFVGLLDRVRVARDLDVVVEALNERCCLGDDIEPEMTLTCTNRAADALNQAAMAALDTEEHLLRGTVKGEFRLGGDRLPSPLELRLKVGAQVMFTKNDEQERWVNGSLGVVRAVSADEVRVCLAGDPARTVHEVRPASWESFEYRLGVAEERIVAQKVGEYTQFPLMPAWAVTIHKSQGKTLERVLIDFGRGAFATGQAYVALSRCRSLRGIRLARPLRASDVSCDARIRRFYHGLARAGGAGESSPLTVR
ncbi:MAG: AAA family ATPase [Gaiellales bacterium]|nr:AAA family ATPase [Gaiellales bacterium]